MSGFQTLLGPCDKIVMTRILLLRVHIERQSFLVFRALGVYRCCGVLQGYIVAKGFGDVYVSMLSST